MLKKLLLAVLTVLALGAAVTYLSEPVFWQRYVGGFLSAGDGANSVVFDVRETVSGRAGVGFPEAERLSPETRSAIDDYAAAFDSFALLVVVDGELVYEWYAAGYDRDSLTQSQSMHKSLQALLVGIAVDEGRIASIDDPIMKYLPDLELAWPGTTIRHVLQMSSGLEPFAGGFSPFGGAFRWLYGTDLRAATLAIRQTSPPGLEFDYHDANSQLIGMLLDAVWGARYAEYLSSTLWQPLGAGNAEVWLDRENGMAHHNCCLLARAVDWARVGQMIIDGGKVGDIQVISENGLSRQFAPGVTPHYGLQTWLASNDTPNPRPGAGGYLRSEDWLADDVVYFSGYGAQRVYVSREKRLVIVRLGPAAGYFPAIANDWDNTYLFNTVVRDLDADR